MRSKPIWEGRFSTPGAAYRSGSFGMSLSGQTKAAASYEKTRRLWQLQPYMLLDFFIFFELFLAFFVFIFPLALASILCSELWVVVAWPGG